MHLRFAAAAFVLVCAAAPAAAQAPDANDGRFQIERQDDVIIRLDKQTGAISTCTREGQNLDCRMSADERAALQAEIDRLAAEVEELRAGHANAEGAPGTGISKDGKELTLKLPSEEEIKGVVAFFEDMFRRFVDAVRDFVGDTV